MIDRRDSHVIREIEMTFRDGYLRSLPTAAAIPESEKHALVNHDVSYVDSMLLPAA
jgi:hypothetical protein